MFGEYFIQSGDLDLNHLKDLSLEFPFSVLGLASQKCTHVPKRHDVELPFTRPIQHTKIEICVTFPKPRKSREEEWIRLDVNSAATRPIEDCSVVSGVGLVCADVNIPRVLDSQSLESESDNDILPVLRIGHLRAAKAVVDEAAQNSSNRFHVRRRPDEAPKCGD